LDYWSCDNQAQIYGIDATMNLLKTALLAVSVMLMPTVAHGQAAAPAAPVVTATAPAAAPSAAAPSVAKVALPPAPAPLSPNENVGQPVEGQIGIQPQVTDIGLDGLWLHNAMLMPIITVISLFVLGLLFWVAYRYRAKANPIPSKTSHNAAIEVAWTLIPALILVAVAVPSIKLLAAQFKPAGKDAVTIKVIGHQWYWSYEYPDHGGFEVAQNMLTEDQAAKAKEPYLLGVDNRLIVPVDTEIRAIVTSDDVIHSWAVPAFWTKMDAVPGRLNEVTFKVQKGKEGVYYGQCSELCGARHGRMPIAVEVVTKENFAKWIASKGGTMPSAIKAAAPAAPAAAKTEAAAVAAPNAVAPAAANATN
jgi:cytochrome c oxidase subunit II